MIHPYYQQDGITIYHGDCRDVLDEWEGLRTHSFDLLLTDPPYGLDIAANPFRQRFEPQAWDFNAADSALITAYRAICRNAIIWGGNYFQLPQTQCFLIWDKGQSEAFSSSMCEQAWTSLKQPAKLFRRHAASYIREHPTEKPEDLMCWCLGFIPGARNVLDPFMGSGTTLVAAKRLGKQATGIEREERYCEIAAKRLSQGVLSEMFT